MRKRISALLCALLLWALLLPCLTQTAQAGDWDYIDRYAVTVSPNAEDGSLTIRVDLRWTVLEEGPVYDLKVGVPNGSIREAEALSDNIGSLDFDNSFMYIEFNRDYDTGETFDFAYQWTQEYMYTLDESGGVQYNYTPGWFDEAHIGEMSVTWLTPTDLMPLAINGEGSGTEVDIDYGTDATTFTAQDLPHGAQISLWVGYDSWPTELYWEQSSENLPQDDYYDDDYYDDYMEERFIRMAIQIIVLIVVLALIFGRRDGYAGGFGTRYVLYHGLWYPQGPDGRPRPGSTGMKHKPRPPRSGFGGGSRGGGFGGSGFGGGGGHCACASSCACACACACAGGGRAGCSAKNLYGAVKLSRELTEELKK